jgi:hypothetical protein
MATVAIAQQTAHALSGNTRLQRKRCRLQQPREGAAQAEMALLSDGARAWEAHLVQQRRGQSGHVAGTDVRILCCFRG